VRPEDVTTGFIAWAVGGVIGALPAGFVGDIGRRNAMLVGFGIMAVTLFALDRVTSINGRPLLALASASWTFLTVNAYPLFVEPVQESAEVIAKSCCPSRWTNVRTAVRATATEPSTRSSALLAAATWAWARSSSSWRVTPPWHSWQFSSSRAARARPIPGQPDIVIPLSVLDLAPIVEGGDAAASFRAWLARSQDAERLGYRRFWLAEHQHSSVASAATSVLIAHVAGGRRRYEWAPAASCCLTIRRS
jgi:hypothetical protein